MGPGADLRECGLKGAKLQRENLKRADLARADLRRADLRGARLNGANLTGARVGGADFGRANLSGITLKRAHGLAKANLQGARGLGDRTLAIAFGVAPGRLPTYLASNGVHLESPAVIGGAVKRVCNGGSMPKAAAKPNGTLAAVGGHSLGTGSYAAPRSWAPMARRYASRVACISDQPTVVETCYYSLFSSFEAGEPVDRVQDVVSVAVRDAHTGRQVGSTSFAGGYPRECPGRLLAGTEKIWGSAVPAKTITGWLTQWRGKAG